MHCKIRYVLHVAPGCIALDDIQSSSIIKRNMPKAMPLARYNLPRFERWDFFFMIAPLLKNLILKSRHIKLYLPLFFRTFLLIELPYETCKGIGVLSRSGCNLGLTLSPYARFVNGGRAKCRPVFVPSCILHWTAG